MKKLTPKLIYIIVTKNIYIVTVILNSDLILVANMIMIYESNFAINSLNLS